MAAKKTRSKKSASKARASGGKGKKKLRTQFMADFTKKFIGDPKKTDQRKWPDPNRLWPNPGQLASNIVTDYATFVNVLMTVGYVLAPPPAFPIGSLGERIGQFLNAENWPSGTKVPLEYADNRDTVHLVEIAVILDRLLQAINSFEVAKTEAESPTGGGGSGWPPH